MLRFGALRWCCAVLLLGTLLPALASVGTAPVLEAQAQASLTCDGSTTADYNGPCGPSFTVPRWSDGSGWDLPQYYETIMLADFDGDGADELLARSAAGFVISKWNSAYGQWLDMGVQSFPDGATFSDAGGWDQPQYYSTIQAAELGYNGGTAASLLMNSGSGIVAFQWDGKQTWTALPAGPAWGSSWNAPQYYSTIQTWGNWLIGRAADGIQTWRFENGAWALVAGTGLFSDAAGWDKPQYYETIKLVDLFDDGTPELVGRAPDGMQVFTWDGSDWGVASSGGPFTDAQGWNQPQYYQTLIYGELNSQPGDELLGRAPNGMVGFGWTGVDWIELTLNPGLFTDGQGWNQPRYYSTIEFVTLQHGTTVLSARGGSGLVGYRWDANSGNWSEVYSGPALADNEDGSQPWAQASQYGTLRYGDIDGDGVAELVARGQYGIRTWSYDTTSNSWGRPLAYGFQPYSDSGQQATFELVSAFLNIEQGSTIRSWYTSLDSEVGQNYQNCLNYSLTENQPLPPTETCYLVGPAQTLANPDNVTSDQWTAMVHTLQAEIAMAGAVDGYFNQSLAAVLNDIFAGNENSIAGISSQLAIDERAQSESASGTWFSLFIGLGEAFVNFATPGWVVTVDAIGAAFSTLQNVSSSGSSGFNEKVAEVQAQLTANNTAAIDQNNAFFQYVAQDYGLLYAVGTMVDNQAWLITADVQNDMVSVGRWHFAKWTYQTLLPTIWAITQDTCTPGPGNDCPDPSFLPAYDVGPAGDGLDWSRYLYDKHSQNILDGNDPALVKMFSAVQSGCYLTDQQGAWNYASCNLGLNRAELFEFENGWSFSCELSRGGRRPDMAVEATAPHSAAGDAADAAPVNPGSSDVFHAAVLSSATFDARTIDPTTVTLAGAPVIGWWVGSSDLNPDGTVNWPAGTLSDVNGDGLIDVLLNFHQAAMQLQAGDTSAYLEGETIDGEVFVATIPVSVIGP